jgi:flagellar M-ring protein FliF
VAFRPPSTAGYELFDQVGSLGLTSFMQEVTRVRALEGEIARTIQSINGISAARVHIVMAGPRQFPSRRTAAIGIGHGAHVATNLAPAARPIRSATSSHPPSRA